MPRCVALQVDGQWHAGNMSREGLDVHGQKFRIKLTKLMENTITFSQFQFNILKTIEKVTPTDKLDRIKNFDSVWSSI